MGKLTILLDLDDVLNNQNELWIHELNRLYNRTVKYEDITAWEMEQFYPGIEGRHLAEPLFSDRLLSAMRPSREAVEYTWRWYCAGHHLVVVTATSLRNASSKVQWLYRNYRWFDERNFIITQKKQLIDGDILIDDGFHNFIADPQSGRIPAYTGICLDRPWNRGFDCLQYGVHRAKRFQDIDEAVELLSEVKGM